MLPADAADPNLTVPSFGLLGSTAAFLPIPVGNRTVKLTRTVGNEVVYAPPPAGHGLGGTRWDKDPLGGPNGYAMKLPTQEVRGLVSLRHWRGVYASAFPENAVTSRGAPAAKQLTEFARGLLSHAADLHAQGWRLGLLSPDSVYLSQSDPARVFLPDVGFAWVGQMALTKPAWLSTEPTDAALWGEDRKLRQLAAPDHLRGRHPAANKPTELVQHDLKTVGQLLAFMVSGKIGGPEPAAGRRCPVWGTIRAANAGQFDSADAMLEHLLTGMKAPLTTDPPAAAKGGGAGKWIAVLFVLLLLGGGGVAAWYFLTQNQPVAGNTSTSDSESTPTTDAGPSPTTASKPTTPATTPTTGTKPPVTPADPKTPAEFIELAKKQPQHPKVVEELQRLRNERKKVYDEARNGSAAAARLARDLQDQIDRLVAAQRPPEAPK